MKPCAGCKAPTTGFLCAGCWAMWDREHRLPGWPAELLAPGQPPLPFDPDQQPALLEVRAG